MKNKITYVVSSFIPSIEINQDFLQCLENFKRVKKATLLLMPSKSFYFKDEESILFQQQKDLLKDYVLLHDKTINKNLSIKTKITKNIGSDPLSDLKPFTAFEENCIIPFPSHRFKTIPRFVKNNSLPRGIWCSGSISNNHYPSKKSASEHYHKLGALIIEQHGAYFNVFQITYDEDKKGFYHLDKFYSKDKVKKAAPLAISMGDDHYLQLCHDTIKETKRVINKLKIPKIFHHDTLDFGNSESHHQFGKTITQIKNNISVYEEIKLTSDYVASYKKDIKHNIEQFMVPSNHPEHLEKWLDKNNKDILPQNQKFWHEISILKIDGKNVYEEALKMFNPLSGVNFYDRKDSLKVAGIEMLDHGDFGANGSKANPKQKSVSYNGKCITGHTHSPEITLLDSYVNGTSTKLILDYTNPSSSSSWLNTHTIVYKNGTKSHIHIIFNVSSI